MNNIHHTVQSVVLPNLEVPGAEDMYLRLNDRAFVEMNQARVQFMAGGIASSDTFYNGLTVGTWKRCCNIGTLVLCLQGSGSFVLTLGLHRHGQASVWLSEHALQLTAGRQVHLPVPAWPQLDGGMLFFRLRCLNGGVLNSAAYVTPDPAPNRLRLGLVITHFNRPAQVLSGVNRLVLLLEREELRGRITLTIVDNSRNLPLAALAAHPGVRCIPNRNLGGTGGFVRGLLELMDEGSHTHALFMDDDASCEIEAVARSFALLQYAREDHLSVAGALLRERAPWHLFEKGARFDGKVQPLCSGLDMRRVDDLLEAERPLVRPDYGAWWFFAFPLTPVRRLPFPFFVRGDDVMFGLDNPFRIVTLNGVACLGEDFSTKHSPMTAYLDARYHVVHALLNSTNTASRIFWIGSRLFLKQLTSYHYTSARAVTLAMRHAAQGPEFFRVNLDLQAVRGEIDTWVPSEKMNPIDRCMLDLRPARRRQESRLRRLGRAVTLQGFLLPGWLLKNRITVQEKAFHGRASAVFRYRRVLYEHAPTGTGYIAQYDRARFFAEMGAFVGAFASLLMRLPALKRAYAVGYERMTSMAFWREVYAQPGGAPGPLPTVEPAATGSSRACGARRAVRADGALDPLAPAGPP